MAKSSRRGLSTLEIAQMLGIAVASVAKWIDQGKLLAGRTPGGHRRVPVDELVKFLNFHRLPIPPELISCPTKILVVDDDLAVREWLISILKAEYADCEILEAKDGFSAGEMFTRNKPDVVLLDLMMPGMDGYEVCRRIKTSENAKQVQVIMITGNYGDDIEENAHACGARMVLHKPLDGEMVLRELSNVLQEQGRALAHN